MKIKKAVIPVAGLGTRMLPMTKAIPKEMLPIVDKPMIQYIVEECAAAGLTEIVLVTHSSKNAIENHFDNSYELESILENRLKQKLLATVKSTIPTGVTLIHVRQGVAKGLGHAIHCAYPVVGEQPFAVILPDVLIDESLCNPNHDNLAHMIKQFNDSGLSQVLVEPVPDDDVNKYGIVDLQGATLSQGQSENIHNVVEKPKTEAAPSNLSIVGRYVFSPQMWSCLKATSKGVDEEIQLTDAISLLMKREAVQATPVCGKSHDCGFKLGYLRTNFLYASRRKDIVGELDFTL